MFRTIAAVFVSALILAAAFANDGLASEPALPVATYASVGASTSVPYGWVDFCSRRPEECTLGRLEPVDLKLTKKTWGLLNSVNKLANSAIEPITNLEHWGTMVDHWDYPIDGKGDCKVFALYKRKLLVERGFPRQALLMTVVRDLDGEGHAILTVKTDHGEFVLDNLTDEIRPWEATGYSFVKRQSQSDPNVWLELGGARGQASAAARTADGG
jgi:predicted transglutaminase-like cysteine proteinase